MNPNDPSREQIEARITALLLGELPADEAQLLRWTISQDAALKKLQEELATTIVLVREAGKNPAATAGENIPLKLSDARRKKLLAHFQTPRPKPAKELFWLKRIEVPSLVTMLVVVALVAMLAAMMLPALSKAKSKAQSASIINNLRQLDLAKNEWAADNNKAGNAVATMDDLKPYLGNNSLQPIAGEKYVLGKVSEPVVADIAAANARKLGGNTTGLPRGGDNRYVQLSSAGAVSEMNQQVAFAKPTTPPPAVITVAPEPKLALPPTEIVLPKPASEPGFAFQAGTSASMENDGRLGAGQAESPATIAASAPATPVFVTPNHALDTFELNPDQKKVADQNRNAVVGVVNAFSGAGSAQGGNGGGGSGVGLAEAGKFDLETDTRRPDAIPSATTSTMLARNGLGLDDIRLANNPTGSEERFYRNTDREKNADGTRVLGDMPMSGKLLADRVPSTPIPAAAFLPSAVSGSNVGNGEFSDGKEVYVVKSGDTLTKIAKAHGTTVKAIETANNLSTTKIKVGEKMQLPAITVPVVAPPPINSPVGSTAAVVSENEAAKEIVRQKMMEEDKPIQKASLPAPIPQPEVLCRDNSFSTFSLNVSDVSFKLAAASLENGRMPEAASIRSEEFINAFDYRDPAAAAGQPVAFTSERARYPFAQNRDLLRFSIKTAAAGRAADRPLNLVLLLDTSGSMERADRVAIIREAMRVLTTQLHSQDTVSVVTFARIARLWADGVAGDKAGETLSQVGGITPEGGTNLEEAMRLAYETARRHYLANGINRVVLLTDGAANLGNVDAAVLKQKVEAQRKQGIALDCFGIGWEDFNDDMLAELSGNGDGRYAFINTPEETGTEFAAKLAGALQVAAQDVKVQVEFNPLRVISWRQIGYAKHQLTKEQFRDDSVLAAEIAAQEAGNALYTVETKPDGSGPVATVYVRYKIPGTEDVQEHSWTVPYAGNAVALGQASAAMRLAATAGAFSEWLAASPFAQEVSPDELLKTMSGVPQIYGADQRPKKLEWMIRQAKSLSGK